MSDEPLCSVVRRPVPSRSHERIEVPTLGSLGHCPHSLAMTSCLHDLGVGAGAPHPRNRRVKKVPRHPTRVKIVKNEESSTQ
jgi:hypothetical protein